MNNLEDSFNSSQEEENSTVNFQVSSEENEEGYSSSFVVHQDQLSRVNQVSLGLQKESVFKLPSSLTQFMNHTFRRKNEIFYCVSTAELPIDIKNVKGQIYLPLITQKEISNRLGKIPAEIRKKISTVHLGAVKILIKAQFRNGINTPLKMALIDNRINDRRDCILGAAKGNLAYGKFMFTVYPKFGVSLKTENLHKVLSFVHEFERSDLMNHGDKVFSVTYIVGYALSNSHHSIDYKSKANIELEDVFTDIGKIEENQFCDLTPLDNSWAIDIAKEKQYIGEKPRRSITLPNKEVEIGESSTSTFDRMMLKSLSKRIDNLGAQLNRIVE